MSRRLVAALWIAIGVIIWNAFFDLYVSRGAREYLQLRAEYELRGGTRPEMDQVMAQSIRDGWIMSSVWTAIVMIAGWGTIWAMARTRRTQHPAPGTQHDAPRTQHGARSTS